MTTTKPSINPNPDKNQPWTVTYRSDLSWHTFEVTRRDGDGFENYTVDIIPLRPPTCGCGKADCEHIKAVQDSDNWGPYAPWKNNPRAGAGGGGTGPISDDAMLVLHDIAEGESTGDPDEYREWDSMISQERRIIQDELEPHYVTFITIPVNDGKRAMSFWIVTPAGLDLLRDAAPRGTTALAALPDVRDYAKMNLEQLHEEKLRVPYWRKKKQITYEQADERIAMIAAVRAVLLSEIELRDAQLLLGKNVDHLATLLRALPAPAQPSAPAVTVTNTLTPAHYELLDTLLACDIDIDKQAPENAALLRALESHHLVFCYTEDAYGKPCNTYTISSLGETTIRQYQRNTPPAEPVGDLDDLTRAEMQADAAQPEAARAKLSKDDIWFLRQFSGEWRASFGVYRRAKQKQFKGLLDIRKGNGKGMYEYVLTEAGRAALDGAK